ncbi:MAG: alpha/beta fold hydrolase [Dehalococcoidia bacterium]
MTDPTAARPADEQPTQRELVIDGVSFVYFDWAGDGPTVVLAHATGFHGRTWDAVARRLPGYRVLALDLRGHGRSAQTGEPESWEIFGVDTADFVRELDLRAVLAVGHSMGGHSVTIAAKREPERFAGLLLVDPVMPLDRVPPREGRGGVSDFVRKRRNEWGSAEEMVERFRDRFPYSSWRPEVLDDYARWGLLPHPAGEGFVLACTPDMEGGTYAASGHGPAMGTEVIPFIDVPVTVMRGRQPVAGEQAPPFSTSPTPPQLASLFADGEDLLLAEYSHFIPMEAPERVAEQVRALDARVQARHGVTGRDGRDGA